MSVVTSQIVRSPVISNKETQSARSKRVENESAIRNFHAQSALSGAITDEQGNRLQKKQLKKRKCTHSFCTKMRNYLSTHYGQITLYLIFHECFACHCFPLTTSYFFSINVFLRQHLLSCYYSGNFLQMFCLKLHLGALWNLTKADLRQAL